MDNLKDEAIKSIYKFYGRCPLRFPKRVSWKYCGVPEGLGIIGDCNCLDRRICTHSLAFPLLLSLSIRFAWDATQTSYRRDFPCSSFPRAT